MQAAGTQLTSTGFNIYTCPGSTLTSGTLRISNTSGGAATVDVAIVESTDQVTMSGTAAQKEGYNFGQGGQARVSSHYAVGTWNSTAFNQTEVVTWTNANITNPADGTNNHSAKVHYWDSANTKLWLYDLSHPAALTSFPAPTDVVLTGAGGGTLSVGPTYAGSEVARGGDGLLRYYDGYDGICYVNNAEHENNLKYKYLFTLGNTGGTGERKSSTAGACYVTDIYNNLKSRPIETTITAINAVTGAATTPVAEFITNDGTEVQIASVAAVNQENFIVKEVSVSDNGTLEIPGIVLGQYQSIYVACAAQVQFSLVGFEEATTVTAY
jgi:hypothetical protein